MDLLQKAHRFDVKAVDIDEGTFEGHSAGIGNQDSIDDIIQPGAFRKTIRERVPKRMVKLLDQHDSRTTRNLWGHVLKAEEQPVAPKDRRKFDDASHTIWTLFQASKTDPDAMNALRKLDEGILDALSIGFVPTRVEFVKADGDDVGEPFDDQEDGFWEWLMGRAIRNIKELQWWETSFVIWGANKAARPIRDSIKSLFHEIDTSLKRGEHTRPLRDDDAKLLLRSVLYAVRKCEDAPDVLACALGECRDLDGDLLRDVANDTVTAADDQRIVEEYLARFTDAQTVNGRTIVIQPAAPSVTATPTDTRQPCSCNTHHTAPAAPRSSPDAADDNVSTSQQDDTRTGPASKDEVAQYLDLLKHDLLEV